MKPPQLGFGFAPEGTAKQRKMRRSNSAWVAGVYRQRKLLGLCVACGGPRDSKILLCSRCKLISRKAQRRWDDAHPENRSATAKARYLRKVAAGVCSQCGHGVPELNKKRCAECNAKDRVFAKAKAPTRQKRDKAAYLARKVAGACTEAPCAMPATPGRTRCEEHRLAQNRRSLTHLRRHPEIARARGLKHKFGLSIPEWNAMLEAQGGRCAICGTDKPGARQWATDHDHVTGAVRALLCNNCNSGIGMFRESVEVLALAIEYLRKHKLTLVV